MGETLKKLITIDKVVRNTLIALVLAFAGFVLFQAYHNVVQQAIINLFAGLIAALTGANVDKIKDAMGDLVDRVTPGTSIQVTDGPTPALTTPVAPVAPVPATAVAAPEEQMFGPP